ncbi:ABC transporter ATP-binding protein [Maledivibacter halophilus]|uniref:Amino acid/amide ABC transporter ATP-binding protein 1, HAAT family n=1 Tax=Maledivibacter halophilus TaxID=36842 RepID=A0A1T5M9V0_9FIRM|nr:ABC transporter ATP-binding protein [Maledivibacter halophilus]SKC84873.1 amino acid/amide ABC transporter ATP-binding protein 1, HAAT family [Maledivibacter halophilus]
MALLEVKGLSKHFGGLVAVDGVSFEVNQGEIISIIGPNGAGKTTLFNMLTGVYTVTDGEIVFDGNPIQNQPPQEIVKAGIARTFQNIRLFSDMRVIENVLVGMHINTNYNFLDILFRTKKFRGKEVEKHEKAIEILDSIGLKDKMHNYAVNLPYGDQRRLEIARAISTDAKIILLDEPAAGMNERESDNLLNFIKKLRDKGYTIIMIEHDMSVVMNISDRIYVIDYGKKIAEGLPAEIANNKRVIEAYLGRSE